MLTVTKAVYGDNGYDATMTLTIDGITAEIRSDQKMIRQGIPYVFLGSEWTERVQVVDPSMKIPLDGFTADPIIARLAIDFIQLIDSGGFTFDPHPPNPEI